MNYFLTNRLGIQLVANANSLPINTAGLSAGLVYWTGSGRNNNQQEEQANSQTDPGRWVLEGSFSVNSQKMDVVTTSNHDVYQTTTNNYTFSPSVGFFIKKNNLIGLAIPISYAMNQSTTTGAVTSSSTNKIWQFGLSPYFQQYWTSTRLTPFTRVNVGYTNYNGGSSTGKNINGGLTIGLAYMAGERFIIETSFVDASIAYQTVRQDVSQITTKTWNADMKVGLVGNFALRYVLR